ncbi:TM2 domain-containing protein [Arthrobacter sp. ERGS1:01]|uniref:TM2 domain-containing protein n=1 Tax=Arthrobacter sp. ERGS1:01 TaxID=1704044 RepID=UPI0006B67614|nr:TM2 domain-containing protein [Arthrobacter sp. ERGS1:01]
MSENQNPEQPADPYGQPAPSAPEVQPVPEAQAAPEAPAYPSVPSDAPADPYGQPAPTAGYGQPAPATYQPPAYPEQQYQGQPPAYQGQPYQGQPYQGQPYAVAPGVEQKSKIVAGILGILLGSLGIHNFYLGNTRNGLIQLLVSVISLGFLAPFMGIWGLIEGILILVGHENYRTDAKGVPLKD